MAGELARYDQPDFWEKQYAESEVYSEFEWYLSLQEYKDLLLAMLPKDARILNIGCGTSGLSEALYHGGRKQLVNIDISSSCIELMKRKCEAMRDMEWLVMDATQLTFEDESFDVVIDKATSDVFMAVKKSEMSTAREQALKLFREAWRVLRPNGLFIIITRFRPRKEAFFFNQMAWKVESHRRMPAPRVYSGTCHVYSIRKPADTDERPNKVCRVEDLEDSGGSDDDTSSDDESFCPSASGGDESESDGSESGSEGGGTDSESKRGTCE